MVQEAEQFASEDEFQRKRIEALNSLSSFVYGLKSQLGDQEGLGGKIDDADKKTILAAVKDTTDWIDENGQSASTEDLEEKLSGECSIPKLWIRVRLMDILQRSKAWSTLLPANFTLAPMPLVLMMKRTLFVTTTNCKRWVGSAFIGGYYHFCAVQKNIIVCQDTFKLDISFYPNIVSSPSQENTNNYCEEQCCMYKCI